jgi:hypothetical protein
MSWSAGLSDFELNLMCLLAGMLQLWNASFRVFIIHSVWPSVCHLIVCSWLALFVPFTNMQMVGPVCAIQ